MESFTPLSVVDQLVAHLRGAIARGELGGSMPGIRSLASTLGVSSNTVTAALERLESEDFLKPLTSITDRFAERFCQAGAPGDSAAV